MLAQSWSRSAAVFAVRRSVLAPAGASALQLPLQAMQQQRVPMSTLSREERNKNRPMSPHVTIYDWPIAAIASIANRITGSALAIGLYGIGMGSLVGADMAGVMTSLGSSSIGPLVKFNVAFPLIFHTISAGRHFYWEQKPEGLNPDSQKESSVAIFASSGALSVMTMFI